LVYVVQRHYFRQCQCLEELELIVSIAPPRESQARALTLSRVFFHF
jgi:hypothetical protein